MSRLFKQYPQRRTNFIDKIKIEQESDPDLAHCEKQLKVNDLTTGTNQVSCTWQQIK